MDEYGRFSFLYDPLITPALRPIHQGMLGILRRTGCNSVLDLCCGTGALAVMCGRSGMAATGVDLSAAMLNVARKKQGARFIRADATALPLPDGAFNGVTLAFALHEKPQETALAILTESARVTRPGGVVIVADYRQPEPGCGRWTGRAIRSIERMAGKEHHAHFGRYMDIGGTDGFLTLATMHGACEQVFLNGWAGLYVIHPDR